MRAILKRAASFGALALALAAAPALAQDQPGEDAAADQEGIGDISVTAQRTATVSQRTPLTIDVTNFYVRGVGNNSPNAYSDPAISFNYDGVYIGRPSSTYGVFYDLACVEMLKGPPGR